jgi:hypothetical protein
MFKWLFGIPDPPRATLHRKYPQGTMLRPKPSTWLRVFDGVELLRVDYTRGLDQPVRADRVRCVVEETCRRVVIGAQVSSEDGKAPSSHRIGSNMDLDEHYLKDCEVVLLDHAQELRERGLKGSLPQ